MHIAMQTLFLHECLEVKRFDRNEFTLFIVPMTRQFVPTRGMKARSMLSSVQLFNLTLNVYITSCR